nr:MAG TPA: hypothetical protein [Caudoviricetes sp.]
MGPRDTHTSLLKFSAKKGGAISPKPSKEDNSYVLGT